MVRLTGAARISRCTRCGCEFAFLPGQRDFPEGPRPDEELTRQGRNWRKRRDNAQRLRIENARERMFNP